MSIPESYWDRIEPSLEEAITNQGKGQWRWEDGEYELELNDISIEEMDWGEIKLMVEVIGVDEEKDGKVTSFSFKLEGKGAGFTLGFLNDLGFGIATPREIEERVDTMRGLRPRFVGEITSPPNESNPDRPYYNLKVVRKLQGKPRYAVGDSVISLIDSEGEYKEAPAEVVAVEDGIYYVKFSDGVEVGVSEAELKPSLPA